MLENGFVLLTTPSFSAKQLLNDLQQDWQLTAQNPERQEDSLTFSVGDFLWMMEKM